LAEQFAIAPHVIQALKKNRMANNDNQETVELNQSARAVYILSIVMVLLGLVNATPGFPGYDNLVSELFGINGLTLRKFPYEWFYPFFFALMMLIVALKHSMWRAWSEKTNFQRRFGLLMDLALVSMAITVSGTYLIENEAICLIDLLNGDRAALIAESLKSETEFALSLGLDPPTSVDDPGCISTTGGWLVLIIGLSIVVFLGYTIRVWSLALVLVAIIIASYTILTVLVWYFYGADDINKYLMTKVAGEPRSLADGRPRVHDILVNNASGMLGRFMDIVLNTIFPYLVLGSLFGTSAGGKSLMKLAFRWTRNLRGGPAHAAIISSAMFGTISGGPIVNVLSTGVLTIPMMLKRGFNKTFAGGVEAAASSGGSIMPPVMGVAAFVVAALTTVPYSSVIIAAVIPAVAYFFCLFLSVSFQARKQNIQPIGKMTEDMLLERQDFFNLLMIFGPILLILTLLLTSKEDVGCGYWGAMIGAERIITEVGCKIISLPWILQLVQNAAGDAGSAGWFAVILLMGLLFLDPEVRTKPKKLLDGLSGAGILISTLYLMFLTVSIIDFCLKFTGLPTFVSLDVLSWLQSLGIGENGSVLFQLIALSLTMFLAILLGMGMPAVPAYINVALLLGPVLAGLGIATFTAHMFIFYFAVASAITPPVALAAFAASTITKAEPMPTAFSAVKSGIVIFIVPFVFALYPELLLIDAAVLRPVQDVGGASKYLLGYDGSLDLAGLSIVVIKLILSLYLISSVLAKYDAMALSKSECLIRILLALAILAYSTLISGTACLIAISLLIFHQIKAKRLLDLL
jgi:TRAP transporter 4TM/12TM fusion protein